MGVYQMDFEFWNQVDLDLFIADDRDNPARGKAAEIVTTAMPKRRKHATLVEIGCGPGFDYGDHFSKIKRLKYLGLDGSAAMVEHCAKQWPQASFEVGDFASLVGQEFDFTYCKAVLEHNPDFRVPLQRMLRVTRRLALINWYLPPSADPYRTFDASTKVHYNRYLRSDVLAAIDACGFSASTLTVDDSTNELYLCHPK